MKESRPCPGPDAESPCVGTGFIEADRGAIAERCKRCSALRTRSRESARRRELRRSAREGRALSATAPVPDPPHGRHPAPVPRSGRREPLRRGRLHRGEPLSDRRAVPGVFSDPHPAFGGGSKAEAPPRSQATRAGSIRKKGQAPRWVARLQRAFLVLLALAVHGDGGQRLRKPQGLGNRRARLPLLLQIGLQGLDLFRVVPREPRSRRRPRQQLLPHLDLLLLGGRHGPGPASIAEGGQRLAVPRRRRRVVHRRRQ